MVATQQIRREREYYVLLGYDLVKQIIGFLHHSLFRSINKRYFDYYNFYIDKAVEIKDNKDDYDYKVRLA